MAIYVMKNILWNLAKKDQVDQLIAAISCGLRWVNGSLAGHVRTV
jgi:hypothetical protein